MNRKFGIFLLLGFATSAVHADTLLTTREGTLKPGAEVAQDEGSTVRFWSRSDRMARIDDRGKMISDLETGVTEPMTYRPATAVATRGDAALRESRFRVVRRADNV
ncbi:MAG TPA: hypothetical protein VF389_09110 [Woeseiaceae bacterium]